MSAAPRLYTIPLPKKHELSANEPINLADGWYVKADASLDDVARAYRETLKLPAEGSRPIELAVTDDLKEEAYKLALEDARILVRGGSAQALRYALYTLTTLSASRTTNYCAGIVEDEPTLALRGYHLNLSALSRMTMDELCSMIKWAAEAKLNALLIEYDNRFPLPAYAASLSPDALSDADVSRLVSTAESYGMTVIPLMQTMGHLEYLLRDPACESIREVKDAPAQLCLRNPDSLTFIKGIIDRYLELHPHCRYLHIGGDETRQLGRCPDCAAYVKEHGLGRLYGDFMNELIDYVCSKGVTPLVYDDMLCSHPDALDALDRRAVIVYWDYWATAPEMPHLIARYGPAPTYTLDRRWRTDKSWQAEIDDVAQRVLDSFCGEGVEDVESTLGEDFMKRYGPYLGQHFPKYFRAFPYLEYYQDKGFRVIGMPTALGETDSFLGLPNFPRCTANIQICCERMAQAKAMGVITSAWYTYPAAMYPMGIPTTAYYAWGVPDYVSFDASYGKE